MRATCSGTPGVDTLRRRCADMLGSTVPTVGGMEKAFHWGDRWGCDAVQFYLTLSRKWRVDDLGQDGIDSFKEAWERSKVKEVVAHIPYLVNLVSENDVTRERSIERMVAEIERAEVLGVRYLVLHSGSAGGQGSKRAIEVLKEGFDRVFDRVRPDNAKILIETMAGQGSSLGSSFEELAEMLSILKNDDLFGICFDSAHVFEAGYDIREGGYDEVFNEFGRNIPIERIRAFHLNDSKTDCGSRVDRHEHIGEGRIGLDFFRRLLNDERFKDIPKILETPDVERRSEDNLELLRGLV